jgi:pimeloyl-ACP methyl ester carboxylesterase
MGGVVLFLHGLFGDATSWGAVPDAVKKAMGGDFEVETREYSARKLSPADLDSSAGQIITYLQTTFPDREPIYLIGHSLGGLVAREICRKLLLNGPDDLLVRIKAVLTAGCPLEGAAFGNWFLRKLRLLNPKVAALASPEQLYSEYLLAIRESQKRKIERPKFYHFALEDDRVIAKHVTDHFTDDDFPGGVLRGAHTGFGIGQKDAKEVADVLVSTIRRAQNAVAAKPQAQIAAKPLAQAAGTLPSKLVLLACSHTKREGGNAYEGEPLAWLRDRKVRQDILAMRNLVYTLLRDADLEDNMERGGNRSHQPANQHLLHGLDLGGVEQPEAQYLPAYKRYNGRIYQSITPEGWNSYLANQDEIKVLIMSGLYGLIEPTENIQNYDVHLTDTHADQGYNLKSRWLELFTRALDTYVRSAFDGRKVQIFNFLCDHHYVDAVRWYDLPRDQCSVFHFASRSLSDVQLLPPAGTIIDSVLKCPNYLDRFDERDIADKYELAQFGSPPKGLADFRFGFESRVGMTRPAGGSA